MNEETKTESGGFPQSVRDELGLPTPQKKNPFSCPICGWDKGTSRASLNMHRVRKHTAGWKTGGNFKGARGGRKRRHRYPSDDPAYRNKKAMERYYRKKAEKNHLPTPSDLILKTSERLGAQFSGSAEIADAAKAIMVAAKVLRGTIAALKMPS
jgi:hypothetical protein